MGASSLASRVKREVERDAKEGRDVLLENFADVATTSDSVTRKELFGF